MSQEAAEAMVRFREAKCENLAALLEQLLKERSEGNGRTSTMMMRDILGYACGSPCPISSLIHYSKEMEKLPEFAVQHAEKESARHLTP